METSFIFSYKIITCDWWIEWLLYVAFKLSQAYSYSAGFEADEARVSVPTRCTTFLCLSQFRTQISRSYCTCFVFWICQMSGFGLFNLFIYPSFFQCLFVWTNYWVPIIQTGRRNEDLEIQKCVRCEVNNMFSFVCLQSYIHLYIYIFTYMVLSQSASLDNWYPIIS
jgi:hypothetical protein